VVSVAWTGGKLTKATVQASAARPVKVRYAGKEVALSLKAGERITLGADLKTN
jgi:hypothetical protein